MTPELPRPDLFAYSVPTFVIFLMMALFLAVWVGSHFLKGRIGGERTNHLLFFAARVAIAMVAIWAVWQFMGRFFLLTTTWSLWFSAFVGGLSLELVFWLYAFERKVVSERKGRILLVLRSSAVVLVLLVLVQPVFARDTQRDIERVVVVMLDDSGSMQLVDRDLTVSEKLKMATLFGLESARDRYRLDQVQLELTTLRRALDGQRKALALPEGSGAVALRAHITARAPGLREVMSRTADTVVAHREILSRVLADKDRFPGHIRKLLEESDRAYQERLARHAAEALQKLKSEEDALAAQYPALRNHLDALYKEVENLMRQMPRAASEVDQIYYGRLSSKEKEAIARIAEQTRAAIARQVLVAEQGEGEEARSLIGALKEKYHLRLVRFGHRPEEVDVERWIEYGEQAWQVGTQTNTAASIPGTPVPVAVDTGERERLFRQLTDVAGALEESLDAIPAESLAGVLLLTDGRHNTAHRVEDAARRLGIQDSPVCTIVLGSRVGPKDAAILQVAAPESIFLGDKIAFRADLKLDGLRGKQVNVRLLRGDEVVEEEKIRVPEEAYRAGIKFTHVPEEHGIYKYRLEIEPIEGELFKNNNSWDLRVAVTDDRTNVLIVDSYPRWEFRYLRNLFYGRDKSIHLQYVLFDPDRYDGQQDMTPTPASASRKFGDAEASELPESLEEWLKFDAIILGDVPQERISRETWETIQYCVEERGALLTLIAGPRHMPHTLRDPVFLDLAPVTFEASGGVQFQPLEPAYRLALTGEGRMHPVMQQSTSATVNNQIWGSMPPLYWRHAITGVKPGASVLAYAVPERKAAADKLSDLASPKSVEEAINRLGAQRAIEEANALVVAQQVKHGKVFMLNFDRTWRFRYRVGDVYHHKFWGQLMRWGTGENLRSGTEYVRLGSDQLSYTPDEEILILAKVVNQDYKPVIDDTVHANIYLDDELVMRKRLEYREASNGIYEARLQPMDRPGRYRIELEGKKAARILQLDDVETVETEFNLVTARNPVELAELTADRELPARIASLSGGTVVEADQALSLADFFGAASSVVEERRETTLWDNWILLVLIVLLVTTEWIMRKRGGLV